jgi:hypothetical protein
MQLQARLLTHLCQQRNQIQSLVWRRYLSTSNLKEIYEIPKVASWSLKELHQEKHHTQDEHHVLSERKVCFIYY